MPQKVKKDLEVIKARFKDQLLIAEKITKLTHQKNGGETKETEALLNSCDVINRLIDSNVLYTDDLEVLVEVLLGGAKNRLIVTEIGESLASAKR